MASALVALDEEADHSFDLPPAVVLGQVHHVPRRAVVALDLPLRLRMARRSSRVLHPMTTDIGGHIAREVAGAVVGQEPRPMLDRHFVTSRTWATRSNGAARKYVVFLSCTHRRPDRVWRSKREEDRGRRLRPINGGRPAFRNQSGHGHAWVLLQHAPKRAVLQVATRTELHPSFSSFSMDARPAPIRHSLLMCLSKNSPMVEHGSLRTRRCGSGGVLRFPRWVRERITPGFSKHPPTPQTPTPAPHPRPPRAGTDRPRASTRPRTPRG